LPWDTAGVRLLAPALCIGHERSGLMVAMPGG